MTCLVQDLALTGALKMRLYLTNLTQALNHTINVQCRRGYRRQMHRASLNEAAAAGVLRLAGWHKLMHEDAGTKGGRCLFVYVPMETTASVCAEADGVAGWHELLHEDAGIMGGRCLFVHVPMETRQMRVCAEADGVAGWHELMREDAGRGMTVFLHRFLQHACPQ